MWPSLTQIKPQITWPQLKSLTPKFPQLLAHQSPHRLKSLTSHELKNINNNCSSLTTQLKIIFKSTAFHGFKLDVIEWKLEEKGPNPMLLLGETRFGCFVDTYQPWKKVLWVSKLLGKVVSLFVKFLNFYSVSRFLTLEALQVPVSFPFSLSLFLLHFRFKLTITLV